MLLVGLLGIVGYINGHNIIINPTQLVWISAKKGLSNVIIKDIKRMLLLRLRLLKSLKAVMELSKDKNSP